jgi:hypothetical protein
VRGVGALSTTSRRSEITAPTRAKQTASLRRPRGGWPEGHISQAVVRLLWISGIHGGPDDGPKFCLYVLNRFTGLRVYDRLSSYSRQIATFCLTERYGANHGYFILAPTRALINGRPDAKEDASDPCAHACVDKRTSASRTFAKVMELHSRNAKSKLHHCVGSGAGGPKAAYPRLLSAFCGSRVSTVGLAMALVVFNTRPSSTPAGFPQGCRRYRSILRISTKR